MLYKNIKWFLNDVKIDDAVISFSTDTNSVSINSESQEHELFFKQKDQFDELCSKECSFDLKDFHKKLTSAKIKVANSIKFTESGLSIREKEDSPEIMKKLNFEKSEKHYLCGRYLSNKIKMSKLTKEEMKFLTEGTTNEFMKSWPQLNDVFLQSNKYGTKLISCNGTSYSEILIAGNAFDRTKDVCYCFDKSFLKNLVASCITDEFYLRLIDSKEEYWLEIMEETPDFVLVHYVKMNPDVDNVLVTDTETQTNHIGHLKCDNLKSFKKEVVAKKKELPNSLQKWFGVKFNLKAPEYSECSSNINNCDVNVSAYDVLRLFSISEELNVRSNGSLIVLEKGRARIKFPPM